MANSRMKKKKAVAAILFLLCCGMVMLIVYYKFYAVSPRGGGGGGAPVGLAQSDPTQPQETTPGETGETNSEPEMAANSLGPIMTPVNPNGSNSISWERYDENKILYSSLRLVIIDQAGEETNHALPVDTTTVNLKDFGLKENARYAYRVVPMDGDRNLSAMVEGAKMKLIEGSFYVNLEDEAPTSPVITYPVKDQTIATLQPKITWEASRDSDPGEQEALKYSLEVKEASSGKPVAQTTLTGTQYELPTALTENRTYVASITAKDPDGKKSSVSRVTFRVDASREAPSVPRNLYDKLEPKKKAHRLTWDKSSDPNPNGRVELYEVAIAEAGTKRTLFTYKTKWSSYEFNNGVYGQKYVFRVRAVNNEKTASLWSGWSSPLTFQYQYAFVPSLTKPSSDGQEMTIADTLTWTTGPDIKEYQVMVNNGVVTVSVDTPELSMAQLRKKGLVSNGGSFNAQVTATRTNGEKTRASHKVLFVYKNSPPSPPSKLVLHRDEGRWQWSRKKDVLEWSGAVDPDGDPLSYLVIFTPSAEDKSGKEVRKEVKDARLSIMDVYEALDDADAKEFIVTVIAKDSASSSVPSAALKYVFD